MKVHITIDNNRLKSNLDTTNTIRLTEKSFSYTLIGSTQSRSGPSSDFECFLQLIRGTYKIDEPDKITGIDKIYLKCDCINGIIVNGIRGRILYSFVLFPPPGHKIYRTKNQTFFKKEPVLSHKTFYLEDGDYKPVFF